MNAWHSCRSPFGHRPPAAARARAWRQARAWGDVAVVGRNQGDREASSAVGPSPGGDRRRYETAPPSGCRGLWRWVLVTQARGAGRGPWWAAIGHDEDVWPFSCGCQGFTRKLAARYSIVSLRRIPAKPPQRRMMVPWISMIISEFGSI